MRTSIQGAVVAGLALCGVACGEGRAGRMPTGATPPDPRAKFQPVRIVSGADLRPVPGAAVVIEGSPYVSDPKGDVVPGGSSGAGSGASIDVDAPGFLPRRTRIDGERRVTLWPVANDAEAEAVRQMVYGGPRGDVLLPTISNWISLSFELALNDPAGSGIKAVWAAEAAAFGAPLGLRYEEGLARPYETDYEIRVRFAEAGGCDTIPTWGFCQEPVSAQDVSYRVLPSRASDPQTIRRVLASWFLGPNPLPGFMNTDAPASELSPLEVQTIRMILQRGLPNRWPDTDR